MATWTFSDEREIVLGLDSAEARIIAYCITSLRPLFHAEFLDTILGIGFEDFGAIADRMDALLRALPAPGEEAR